MHISFLDPYLHRRSPIHHLDSRIKLLLAVAFILTAALLPAGAWPVYILLFSLALAVEMLSALGVIYVWKRSALALPFVLAALPIVFLPGKESAWMLFGVLPVAPDGLERFLSIAFKSWLSVHMAIVLASSTLFPDLLAAMRALRLPRLLVALFGLMWRYLFVLVDEALRLMRARAARSGESQGSRAGGDLLWRARVAGGMAGNLFLRAFDRSDRIYVAMMARGYDGDIRALPSPPLKREDWLILWFGLLLLGAFLLLSTL